MLQKRRITLGQTLHGYAEGHRLLAASTRLSKAAMHTMLVLSDLSGSNPVPGFEDYLTGYPIPDERFYALARTWYAHEMERPGCVWTHTLLIRDEDLADIPSLGVLLSLFHRPSHLLSKAQYEGQIYLDDLAANPDLMLSSLPMRFSISFLRCLVGLLYALPDPPPVFLVSDSAAEYESLIASLWSQQWPGLRSRFTFCSGSLSHRTVGERGFDLQVIPTKSFLAIKRDVPAGRFLDRCSGGQCDNYCDATWLEVAACDLRDSFTSCFRHYLRDVGEESNPKRSDFRRLAPFYHHLRAASSSTSSLEELVARIAESFPHRDEGVRLKEAVTSPGKSKDSRLFDFINESDLLWALARTRGYDAFSAESLQLRSRGQAQWNTGNIVFRKRVCELVTTDINPLGEDLLAGVVDVMQGHDLVSLSAGDHRIVFAFVERKPSLACESGLWIGAPDYQRELFDHVKQAPIAGETATAIVVAMLQARADSVAADVYAHFGIPALHAFLSWYNRHAKGLDQNQYRNWVAVLGNAPQGALAWLQGDEQPTAETIVLVMSELDPCSRTVQSYGADPWLKTLDALGREMEPKTRVVVAGFLLSFSLRQRGPTAERLAKYSFPVVHDALATDSLDYKIWRRLDPILPRLSWWNSWDKCERLRRGMREAGFTSVTHE
jgi:hypothetical protein